MTDKGKDIRDDEFRIIGRPSTQCTSAQEKHRRNIGVAIVSAIIVIAIGILAIVKWPKRAPEDPVVGVFEKAEPEQVVDISNPIGHNYPAAYSERVDTVINDVRLSIYIPHNAVPVLSVGTLDAADTSIILAVQAADIRADNLEILGSFVLNGKVLTQGESKKGFCSIIDGKITIGIADKTPLFEEAAKKGGYFFRQYPLVSNGVLVESGPKGKSTRRALCTRSGEVFVAISETSESFHDFSQALVDLGVENAIYLVGGRYAYGWYIDADGNQTFLGEDVNKYENENYVIWRAQ